MTHEYLICKGVTTSYLFRKENQKSLTIRKRIFKRKTEFIPKLSKKNNYGNTISFDNGKESN